MTNEFIIEKILEEDLYCTCYCGCVGPITGYRICDKCMDECHPPAPKNKDSK